MTHKEIMAQIEDDRQREIAETLRERNCSLDTRSDCNRDCENCTFYYIDFTKGN